MKADTEFGSRPGEMSETLVSGQNFPADAAENLYFDRIKVGQVTTDSMGSFSNASIEVPKGALPRQLRRR